MTRTSERLVVLGLSILSISLFQPLMSRAMGDQIKVDYQFKLIDRNPNDLIDEPPGDLKVSVVIDIGKNKKAKNPLTSQILRDAGTPAIQEIRKLINEQIVETNELLAHSTDSDDRKKLLRVLGSTYDALVSQAQLEAEFAIRNKWDELVQKDRELKAWKFELGFEIGVHIFGLARAAGTAAGSAGISLVADLNDVITRSLEIGIRVRRLAESEAKARATLQSDADAVLKKLNGADLGKIQRLRDAITGLDKKLSTSLTVHQMKLIDLGHDAQALAIKLNRGLEKEDELKKQSELAKDPKFADAIAELTKARKQYLIANDRIQQAIAEGTNLQENAKKLLRLMYLQNPTAENRNTAGDYLRAMHEAAGLVANLLDPTQLAFELAEKAADKAKRYFASKIREKR